MGSSRGKGTFHVCMVYADVYEVGRLILALPFSHNALGLGASHISCEAPIALVDMAALMRKRNVPLLVGRVLCAFGVARLVGFVPLRAK